MSFLGSVVSLILTVALGGVAGGTAAVLYNSHNQDKSLAGLGKYIPKDEKELETNAIFGVIIGSSGAGLLWFLRK